MRGTYCLVTCLTKNTRIKIGALGKFEFAPGIYVYVGSALSGIEKRVGRHRRSTKKMRWHIDFLLAKAEVLSVIAIPSNLKAIECSVARLLLGCEGASVPIPGFGSSDCSCRTHLVYFGEHEPEWIAEELAMRISLLPDMYPKKR